MDYETLRYEPDGHVVVLTYDRPQQRNAISRQMNAENSLDTQTGPNDCAT